MKPYRKPIENLEDRRMLAVIKGTDVRIIAEEDGTKANGNDVIVKFSANVKSANLDHMRMFGYSNNTLDGGQQKSTINIKSVSVSGNTVTLRTDVQIRKGATITLGAGSVTMEDDSDMTGTVRTTKGLNRNRFTLALRAFVPNDKTYFSADRIAGGVTPTTANTAASESTVRAELVSFLDKKVNGGFITSGQRTSALDYFDSSAAKAIVPAHNLRAAIVSLYGTVGEPAVEFYLNKKNATGKDPIRIDFDGDEISSSARIVETSYTSTGRLKLIWNPNYAGESFAVLSGILAHEVIHEARTDVGGGNLVQVNSNQEEVIANFVEGVVWAQQIVADYTKSQAGTQLVTRANYRTMLILNSGDRQFPRVGLDVAPLKKPQDGAAPNFTPEFGTSPVLSFREDVKQEFLARMVLEKEATDSTPTARAIVGNLNGKTYDASMKFGTALIADIDLTQGALSDAFVMRVARVLQLKV